jgi:transposase
MRKVVEALRLRFEQRLSQREIAQSLGLSQGSVHAYLARFAASGLAWPVPADIVEAELEARLFTRPPTPPTAERPVPDWPTVQQELKRKGVTLQLLWLEYKTQHPDGYQYTQFCRHYHAWADTLEPVLRQVHVAGERTFVDYAGPTMPILDRHTGEEQAAQIFVGALGASHLLYPEATWTQTLPDWIGAHVRMLEYFGGVTALIVPDNASALVRQPCYYEPEINATYQDFATHYQTAILPTRVASPRDKAKVETAVQIVEREILAPLRHERFTSLAELNHALAFARERVNNRPFQKLAGSRRSVFEATERAALRPLPATRYELATWRTAKVNIDYHISVESHLYSVPYALVGATVDVRLTTTTVEILRDGKRVAAHARSTLKGRATTDGSHRPKSHQRHLEWSPSRLVHWGESLGPATGKVVAEILARFPHPEQGYRACLGLLSLERKYDRRRVEAACARALVTGAVSYRSVKSMLATGVDQLSLAESGLATGVDDGVAGAPTSGVRLPVTHEHVRGAEYYRRALAGAGVAAALQNTQLTSDSLTPEDLPHAH